MAKIVEEVKDGVSTFIDAEADVAASVKDGFLYLVAKGSPDNAMVVPLNKARQLVKVATAALNGDVVIPF